MNNLITFMFWLCVVAFGAIIVAFYMDAYDRLPDEDGEWDRLVAAVDAGRADW